MPDNVRITATTNGWMTRPKLHSWHRRIWGESQFGSRHLLVLYAYRPHKSADTKVIADELDTDLMFIPGKLFLHYLEKHFHFPPILGAIIQPMDVSVNKPFKNKMKELWTEWKNSSDSCRTKKGNLEQPTRQIAIDWVSAAWDSISAVLCLVLFFTVEYPTAWRGLRITILGIAFPR